MKPWILFAILGCLLALGAQAEAADTPDDRALSAHPNLAVIARAPDFSLRDTRGRTVRLSDYRGQAVLLAFIFTSCPDVCPLISQQMSGLQRELKAADLFGRQASLLSVTIDPGTDTAEILAGYARNLGADPAGWRFLRETSERTKPVLKAYDEWSKKLPKGELDHPARVYLIDQKGRIREIYSLSFFNEKQAFLDISALLEEAGKKGKK
jgi:protein SCO1/2